MGKCSLSWDNKWPFSFLCFMKYVPPTSISSPRCPFWNRKRPILFCWTRKAMYYLIKANLYFVTLSVKQESLGRGVLRVGRVDSPDVCRAVVFGPGCQSFRTEHHRSQPETSQCVFSFGGVNIRLRNKFSTYSSKPTIRLSIVPNSSFHWLSSHLAKCLGKVFILCSPDGKTCE